MPTDQFTYGLPIRELLLVGLVAAGATLLLTGPVRMLALKVGAVAWPRGRDVHVTPTPRWGGLAMFGGVLAGLLLSLQLPALRLAYFEQSTEVVGVVVATALLVGVGMLDDRYDLDALTKFAAQVTAAGLLVLYGVQWVTVWIPIGGESFLSGSLLLLGQGQSVLMTVLVTVVLVNAMNFVDGLDGLAAGIGLITTLATAVFCVGLISKNGNDPAAFVPSLIAVVLAGSCLGFLPHNFHPARIFMGDTGSMMVGVMLSAAITTASGRIPPDDTAAGNILALVSPVIVLVGIVFIPSLDLLMAVVRRTRAGTSPFSPDKMHLHHRLLQVGHSHRRAVLLVYLWVAVIAFGAVALALVPRTGLVLAATGIALAVAFVASAVPHRSRMRSASAAASPAGQTAIASTDDLPTSDVDDHRSGGSPTTDGPGSGGSPAATGATGHRSGANAATDGPADRRSAGRPAANGAGDRRSAGNPAANGAADRRPGANTAADAAAADRTGSQGRTTRPVPGRVVPGGNVAAGPEPWPRGVHRPAGARGAARVGPGTRAPATPVAPAPHAAGPPTPPPPSRPVPVRPTMPRTSGGPPAPDPGVPGAAGQRPDGARGPQHPRGDGNSDGHRARPAAAPGDQPTVPTPAHHPGHDGDA
ncbi:undecaprenyl/decaprenyl-phosphate alpha-N-acetylglucosaminyl 1-phosphate transferase [Pseudonocardia sp. HH130629-09]|uniref:undecaprenyl/decaprenyl-phosphate alpha-N-acetylglucosaminyl 1-phosphate transferase n=1 Tax=Pseudonocardia sp. HH130629-09 TaxID=1641402 RepID=UPI0007DC0F6A